MPIVLDGIAGITTPTIAATSASTFTGALALPAGGLNVGSGQLAVDASGRVTMPFQPAFAALLLDGQTFNAGVLSGAGSAASFNIGGHYNAANGRFTAPIAGRYLFSCGVLVSDSTGRLEGQLRINGGTSLVAVNGTGTVFDGPTGTVIANLSAGDFVSLIRNLGTAAPFTHDGNYFSGQLIS